MPGVVRDALGAQSASVSGQVINLSRDQRGATISPAPLGYLVEHFSRTVDAIWVGEKSSIPNDRGMRLDTLQAFRRLGPTLVRYPGGTLADEYRWQDGIGPRSQRQVTWNICFGGEEDNQFGTDEFLRFCELVGVEAAIKVNPFTEMLGDTLRWMEYCNYAGNTTSLAKLRARNGHPKPYGVKYWQLGNEGNDAYSAEFYAELAHMWTFHMRQADHPAQLVVTGTNENWNERFLAKYADLIKHGGIAKKKVIHILALKYAGEDLIKKTVALCDKYLGPNELDLAVEEWATGGPSLLPTPPGTVFSYPNVHICTFMECPDFKHYERHVRMMDALGAAGKLHMFKRNAKRVKFATFIYATNTWGAWPRTDGPRFHLIPNYHVFDLLKGHKGADLIGTEFDSPAGPDVVASASKDGRQTTVSLINKQKGESVEARLRLKGGGGGLPSKAAAAVLTGQPRAENIKVTTLEEVAREFETPDKVKPQAGKVEGKGSEWSVLCEPFSLTVVTFEHAG